MSTVDRPQGQEMARLFVGDRLDQPTFHARYSAMPPETRAELVGGVVSMPSPVGYEHGEFYSDLSDWLGRYRQRAPGVRKALNATTVLNPLTEVQPDLVLRLPEDRGGASRIEGGYLTGPPELVVEISRSTRELDLGSKKQEYERSGVREYLVIDLERREARWFGREGDEFEEFGLDGEGVLRSCVFPGLWLDVGALFRRDVDALMTTLDRGMATREYEEFAARLLDAT